MHSFFKTINRLSVLAQKNNRNTKYTYFSNLRLLSCDAESLQVNHQAKAMRCGEAGGNYYKNNVDFKKMADIFPVMLDEISKEKELIWLPEVTDRFRKIITSNALDSKKLRALMFIETYRTLSSQNQQLTEENQKLMYILAWCTEIHQTTCNMMDDILDHSPVRRNRPAWQIITEREGRMELSYNDCHFLKEVVFLLLMKYCRNKPYYRELLNAYGMACRCSTKGLSLDAMMHKNITLFDEDLYSEIATNKTSYPTFVMTIKTAFHMAGFYNEDSWQQIEDIIVDYGIFHQIRNDYQGYKEDVKRGKPEEDIQLGQCTWFIVQALKLADSRQKSTLQKYFGKPGTENALEVSNVYDLLDLPSKYAKHANEMYENMIKKIDRLPDKLAQQALSKVLKVLFDFSDATFQK